jgi:hypothetical protein
MNQDLDHLRLLSIFHYVIGGLMALVSLVPLIHVGLGLMMVFRPEAMDKGNPPPPFLGWFFVVLGSVFILCGLTLAVLTLIAGRKLAARRNYTYCLVIAALLCLFMPLGTALGIFTILVLMRPTVKPLFQANATA